MDWNKAKNIILIVLIFTNVFLLAVYCGTKKDGGKNSDSDVYKYTMNVLEENNIYYEGDIYSGTMKMYPLTVSYGKYDKNMVENAIKNSRRLSESDRNESGYKKLADELVEKCGFMSENTRFEKVVSEGTSAVVTYENYYENTPVQECYMKVYFSDGKITDFDRKWMEVISEGETKIELTAQLSALLKFMTEIDTDERITVYDMDVVYWIDNYDVDGDVLYDTALPAWRISYNSGEVKYISANVQ